MIQASNETKVILEEKIHDALSKRDSSNMQHFQKMQYEAENLSDCIVPLKRNDDNVYFMSNGTVKMVFDEQARPFNKFALKQIATMFGIPSRYVEDLNKSKWGKELLVEALQAHKTNNPRQRVLVRSIDNEIRGVLSDKYKRMDSMDLYTSFMTAGSQHGSVVYDAMHTSSKSFISLIVPEVMEVKTENNGWVHSVFGAHMSNSDFGNGSVSMSAYHMNVMCLNKMCYNSILRKAHLGKRLSDDIQYSERTYELDTMAMSSAVSDTARILFSPETRERTKESILKASEALIEPKKGIIKLKNLNVQKEELEMVESKLMDGTPEDGIQGKCSLWKLSQALTAVANGPSIKGKRMQELDAIAGKLVEGAL